MEQVGFLFISFLRYWGAKYGEALSKRDDFVVDALFYFEPMQKIEYSGGTFSCLFCFVFF